MTLLPHTAGRVFNTPLLISRAKLDAILGVIVPRIQGEPLTAGAYSFMREYAVTPNGIAIIPIFGTLVRRTVGLEAQSGLTSYSSIEDLLTAALRDSAVRGILLDIDSPGGEAGGVFDLADKIFSARTQKPIWAIADEDAFSAAYALAAACEKIYLTRTSGVGSIGVIAVHLDQSQAEEEAGLKYTAVYAGDRKNDMTPHEPLSDPARQQLQDEVSRVYDLFIASVARMRGLDAETVKATQAALYFGEQAVTAFLADKLGTLNDALSDLSQKISLAAKPNLNPKQKETRRMDNPEQLQPQDQTPQAPDLEAVRAEARTEALAYVSEVNELCMLAGMPAKAMDFIGKAVPVAEVRKALLDARAAQADATAIAGQIPANTKPANADPKIDTAAIYAKRNKRKES